MNTTTDLRAQIAALESRLREAEEAERAEGKAAAKALVYEYEWRVVRKDRSGRESSHTFMVERRMTDATVQAIADLKARYPGVSVGPALSEPGKWEGMRYAIGGNLLFRLGGGTLVLIDDREPKGPWASFNDEPLELTEEEITALRNGTVPDSLKRK